MLPIDHFSSDAVICNSFYAVEIEGRNGFFGIIFFLKGLTDVLENARQQHQPTRGLQIIDQLCLLLLVMCCKMQYFILIFNIVLHECIFNIFYLYSITNYTILYFVALDGRRLDGGIQFLIILD